jgi:hypothetical protein
MEKGQHNYCYRTQKLVIASFCSNRAIPTNSGQKRTLRKERYYDKTFCSIANYNFSGIAIANHGFGYAAHECERCGALIGGINPAYANHVCTPILTLITLLIIFAIIVIAIFMKRKRKTKQPTV